MYQVANGIILSRTLSCMKKMGLLHLKIGMDCQYILQSERHHIQNTVC